MPTRPPAWALLALAVVATALAWMLLGERDGPVDPDLGPAVRVQLGPPAPSASPGSDTTGPSPGPSPSPSPTTSPTSPTTTASTSPASGAQTVPRHPPAPAGDDDDHDDDDADHDDD